MDSEVPCLGKQRDWRGLNPCVRGVNHSATHVSTNEHQANFKHKGEPNKAKGNQVLNFCCLHFPIHCMLNSTHQDCSFLLLIRYYYYYYYYYCY